MAKERGVNSSTASGAPSIDDELVPLSIAAPVAYFHINGSAGVPDDKPIEELVRVTAIALCQVAPIYGADGEGPARRLDEPGIERLLLRPLQDRGAHVDLDLFHMRRGDLRIALVSLREARNPDAG
jgi:hypothetical protein